MEQRIEWTRESEEKKTNGKVFWGEKEKFVEENYCVLDFCLFPKGPHHIGMCLYFLEQVPYASTEIPTCYLITSAFQSNPQYEIGAQ